jgi:dihydrodipicolinate synthase/N-acetylneuraminate lyase
MPKTEPLFHGIVPPLLTPLTATGGLDIESLHRLLAHVIDGGVHGLFALGTTGEFPSLSPVVRRDVIRQTCRITAGRVPVVVGVTDTSVSESIDLAHVAADAGADAIVLNAPHYLPLTQDEVMRYVRTVLDTQPLPVMLYNFPVLTKTPIEPETVRQLAEDPRVIGVKDSSGDPAYLQTMGSLVRARPDFSLLVGGERSMVAAMKAGAHGCVGGAANFAPRLLVDLYDSVIAGDAAATASLQSRVMVLGNVYPVCQGVSGVVKAIKYAASRLGLCADKVAEPFIGLTEDQCGRIDAVLVELGLIRPKAI